MITSKLVIVFATPCLLLPCRMPKRRYTVKEIRDTMDSIKMSEVRPLVSRVFGEAEGTSLMQGNLRQEDVPRQDFFY